MNITKNQIMVLLGLLGVSGVSQEGATEGGFILPDVLVQLANTVPLPVLVIFAFIGYLFYAKWKEGSTDRSIICSKCAASLGIEISEK